MDGALHQIPSSMTCLGCLLTNHLNSEPDHYKREKRDIIKDWLYNEPGGWNHDDLAKAIEDFAVLNVEQQARSLDKLRYLEMHPFQKGVMNKLRSIGIRPSQEGYMPVDHEYQEGQVPLTKQELGRLGMKTRSPTVHEKHGMDYSRKFSHGHSIA